MASECVRLVQVAACWKSYLQIQSQLVAELLLLLLGHKHQVNQSLPRSLPRSLAPSFTHRSLRAGQTRLLWFRSKSRTLVSPPGALL